MQAARMKMGLWACVALSGSLVGCGGGAPAAKRIVVQQELRAIGQAFLDFSDANPGKAPARADDLRVFLADTPAAYYKLVEGDYVFLYNVSLQSIHAGAGPASTVVGYERDVPLQGGMVLLADTNTVPMTLEEFRAAPRAKNK